MVILLILSLTACTIMDSDFEGTAVFEKSTSCLTRVIPKETYYNAGDVCIKETRIITEGERVSHSIKIEAPCDGEYYLSVFMVPEDRSTYTIWCNGYIISGLLRPKKTGWQTISFTNENGEMKGISLRAGINEIRFYSSSNDFPEIEVIRMSMSKEDTEISTESYDRYLEKIKSGTFQASNPEITNRSNRSLSQVVDYQYYVDCPLLYSFTKTMVLTGGSTYVTFSVSYLDQPIILDVYKDWVYNISYAIPAGMYYEVTQNFPPGTFMVHIRKLGQNPPCLGLLRISYNNNNYYYGSCLASGYNFDSGSDSYTGDTANIFTCYQSDGTDPVLILEKELPAYYIDSINDNYVGTGDYNWTLNARLKKGFTTTRHAHLFNSSASSPEGTCDLYVRMPFASISPWFPSLQQDDAIKSGDATTLYNCIAWAGDITNMWVWPEDEQSPYYISGAQPLDMFDGYFNSRGYTRSGATSTNAGVALWGKNSGFTHASIRKNSRTIYPHGYDWESKTGANVRLFHERNSLNGDLTIYASYGEIKYYYRPLPLSSEINSNFESFTFSEKSRRKLDNLLIEIEGTESGAQFEHLFHSWFEYCESPDVVIQSSTVCLKEDGSYTCLVDYCTKKQKASLLLTIQKLVDGKPKERLLAGLLLNDIISDDLSYLKEEAYHRYRPGMDVIPTAEGNQIRLAEAYLNQL